MRTALFIAVMLQASIANAELEQVPFNCEGKTCFYTLPKLQPLNGWHPEGRNNDTDATVLVPNGATFENTQHFIYARALSKPLISDNPSLANFISMEKSDFAEVYPSTKVIEVSPIASTTGKKLRSLVIVSKTSGKWEQVTYTEEGDHFIVITLTAKTERAFKQAQSDYYGVVRAYK